MKKFILVFLSVLSLLMLCSCSSSNSVPISSNHAEPTDSTVLKPSATTVSSDTAPQMQLPSMLFEMSWAGGWHDHLQLYPDGTFVRRYTDSDIAGESNGENKYLVYECEYKGHFAFDSRLSDTAYLLTIDDLEMITVPDAKYSEGEFCHVGIDLGIAKGDSYIIYTPDTPVSELPDEVRTWLVNVGDTTECYIICDTDEYRVLRYDPRIGDFAE